MDEEDQDGVQPHGDEQAQPDQDQDAGDVADGQADHVGRAQAEAAGQADEEGRPTVQGTADHPEVLARLVVLVLYAGGKD